MFILFIFLLINNSRSLEWNCTEPKENLLSNNHIYEQCTITVEYLSSEQQKQVCITHTLSIKNPPPLSFSSNYTMQTFKLNSCQLLTLSQLPFTLPSSLEKLDLSYNLLSSFTLAFPLPSYLKYLYLDHNPNLIDINFGHYRVQQQLIGLSLRHNKHIQLSSLPLHLTHLDLTDCNLFQSAILSSVLKSLKNLTHLSLADNQLKQLPLFNERIQLEYLNLSNNHLTFIEDRWLHKHLRNLDLKFNQIKSLEFFKEKLKTNQVLQLSLQGNPLICDCWLGSIIDSSSINITDLSSLQCNSNSIMDIPPDDLLCSYSRHCASDCSCCDFEACDCHSVCPSECLCSHDALWSQHIVKCRQANLSDIHILLPETITELNYEENNIEQLKPFIFVGKTLLIKLNLAKNNIRILTNETFCAASNLQEINLSYNPNLISILSNLNDLFGCLKDLKYIILSKEQIKEEEQISYGWTMDSKDDVIRVIRIKQQTSSSLSSTISTSTETQSSAIYSTYHKESFTYSNIIQNNQTLIIIVFFLLLFILLFLILLISLAICRRKLRRHLTTELQRQRSHQYYYHTQPSIKIQDNNGIIGVNDSLYEQLPSLSSDSEQPFLVNDKKLNSTNPPALPPYPPTFRHYHCCHSTNSPEYQCPTVLVLGNQLIHPNHHECSSELQQCLLLNQQENNTIHYCNKETVFLPTTLCRCKGRAQNTDIYISPNVHR